MRYLPPRTNGAITSSSDIRTKTLMSCMPTSTRARRTAADAARPERHHLPIRTGPWRHLGATRIDCLRGDAPRLASLWWRVSQCFLRRPPRLSRHNLFWRQPIGIHGGRHRCHSPGEGRPFGAPVVGTEVYGPPGGSLPMHSPCLLIPRRARPDTTAVRARRARRCLYGPCQVFVRTPHRPTQNVVGRARLQSSECVDAFTRLT